jgi:AraC family transcriptional regulator
VTSDPSVGAPERSPTTSVDFRPQLGVPGCEIGIRFVSQAFVDSVDWSFAETTHQVLIWRRGGAAVKEVSFERGPSGYVIPRVGNVWIIPAGSRSSAQAQRTACEFAQLTIPTELVGAVPLHPVADRRDPLLHHMVERIASAMERTDLTARLLRESLVDSLRLHLLDCYGEGPQARANQLKVLDHTARQLLVDFIRDSLHDEIDLAALAGLVGMPVPKFRRAFTHAFNTTPYQYVLDQRVEKSKALLASTAMTVTEISVAVGFSTPSHFATTFKQRLGITPTEYRHSV